VVRALLAGRARSTSCALSMTTFTLWVFSEPWRDDLLLVAELPDGTWESPLLVTDEAATTAFLAERGLPAQILSHSWSAVRRLREVDARLYQLPASILKPKELLAPLVRLAFLGYRR
jgi:hypothetical protein